LKKWALGGNEHWWIAGNVRWSIAHSGKSTDVSDELIDGNNVSIDPG
jgi:hypothetical protein